MNSCERSGTVKAMCLAVLLAVAAASGSVAGQGQGSVIGTWDYYKASATPESAQALRNVETYHIEPGVQRMKQRNYGGALQDFEFILGFFPNHPKALTLISELCDLNWKAPQCNPEPYFQRAIEINPKASQTYVVYGLHMHRRKSLDRAVDNYKRALELNPASSNAHYNLGLAYFDMKRFELANQHAQAGYALGFPLSGLKDKLTRAGQWKVLPEDDVKRMIAHPDTDPTKPQ